MKEKKVSDQKVFKNYFYTPLPLREQIEYKSFFLTNQANVQTNIIGQRGDDLIIQSNFQEKNHAIYLLHPSVPNQVSILIPSTDGYIKNSWNFGENIIVEYQYQNEIYLSVYDFKGNSTYTLKIDDGAYISDVSGNDDEMIFSTTSFYSAPVYYQLDLKNLKLNTTKEIQLNYDPHLFVTRTVDYLSKDGTPIPMYITHRKDLNLKDKHPTLLYGYGGFGISVEPFFHPSFLHFMQYGGILAVPKIRGGGDYPGWHDMGKRHQKQNSINDFIAAAEYLNSNYTSPQQLAITGGSQGGLLVLSTMAQRPELFKAVIARSGLSDMIRYDQFNIGYSYKDEYGDPKLVERRF